MQLYLIEKKDYLTQIKLIVNDFKAITIYMAWYCTHPLNFLSTLRISSEVFVICQFFSRWEPEAYKSWIIWSWLTVNKQQAIKRKTDFEEYALICSTNYCFNLGLSLEYSHGQFLDISINSHLRRYVENKESTFKPLKLHLQMSEQKNEADVKESLF